MEYGERRRACDPPIIPAGLRASTAGYHWSRDTVGESGAAVYRLSGHRDAPDLFLKHGTGAVACDIAAEAARLRWLVSHLPVPRVVRFSARAEGSWLLTTAIDGETAYEVLSHSPGEARAIIDAIASFLRRWHAIPVHACPFDSDHLLRLAQARARIDAALVDTDDFDDERQGWTAEQVWQRLCALLPLTPDPVVTHGDFSLDNILIRNGAVVGCIDVGQAGVADRYQDLAILWNCLGEFGADLQQQLFSSYGSPAPDICKLEFHLLLDELF